MLLALTLHAGEPARSDAQIESQLKTKLAKSVIGKDGFTFRVKESVVYWDGATSIPQHKGSATRMAKSAGAKRVVNQIKVAGAKGPARAVKADAEPAASPSKPVATHQKPVAVPVANPPAEASPKRATVHWVPAH